MRKLIVEEWVSVDGYAADKNGRLDFFPTTEANRASDEDQLVFLDRIDLILLGRVTYREFVDYWPTPKADKEIISEKLNGIPLFPDMDVYANLKLVQTRKYDTGVVYMQYEA